MGNQDFKFYQRLAFLFSVEDPDDVNKHIVEAKNSLFNSSMVTYSYAS
jgi:hypothetical protein